MTAVVDRLLERLAGVKQTRPGNWIAKCPAHEDKSPSLSIREKEDDGRVLINCFGGCGAGDVLTAIGLRLSDLFDKPIANHLPPIRGGFNARELLELTAHEVTVAAMLITQATTAVLSADDQARLMQAAARLGKARAMLDGR